MNYQLTKARELFLVGVLALLVGGGAGIVVSALYQAVYHGTVFLKGD
jgi:hypothetical protein